MGIYIIEKQFKSRVMKKPLLLSQGHLSFSRFPEHYLSDHCNWLNIQRAGAYLGDPQTLVEK